MKNSEPSTIEEQRWPAKIEWAEPTPDGMLPPPKEEAYQTVTFEILQLSQLPKKPYSPPTLRSLGKVTTLTLGSGPGPRRHP